MTKIARLLIWGSILLIGAPSLLTGGDLVRAEDSNPAIRLVIKAMPSSICAGDSAFVDVEYTWDSSQSELAPLFKPDPKLGYIAVNTEKGEFLKSTQYVSTYKHGIARFTYKAKTPGEDSIGAVIKFGKGNNYVGIAEPKSITIKKCNYYFSFAAKSLVDQGAGNYAFSIFTGGSQLILSNDGKLDTTIDTYWGFETRADMKFSVCSISPMYKKSSKLHITGSLVTTDSGSVLNLKLDYKSLDLKPTAYKCKPPLKIPMTFDLKTVDPTPGMRTEWVANAEGDQVTDPYFAAGEVRYVLTPL